MCKNFNPNGSEDEIMEVRGEIKGKIKKYP